MSDYTNRPTDYTNRQTYVRETEKSSGGAIAFVVGGLVVAVGILAWAMSDGDLGDTAVVPVESNSTTVTIEPAAPAARDAAPADAGGAATVEQPQDPAAAAPFPAQPGAAVESGAATGN